MKNLALVTLFILIAGTAFAQNWNADNIGIYFNTDPLINNIVGSVAANEIQHCYLVGTNLTAVSTNGFEVKLMTEGASFFLESTIVYPTQALNMASRPNEFIVGFDGPQLIIDGQYTFMEFDVLVTGTTPTCFYIEPIYFASIPGTTAYLDGEDLNIIHSLYNSTGDPVAPDARLAVASFNGLCDDGVPTEGTSWGSVKSLYR